MSPDLPYQIPLAGIAVLVLLYYSISAWKFGILRPITTTLSLAGGGAAGYYALRNMASLLERIGAEASQVVVLLSSALAAAFVFLVLGKIGHGISGNAHDPESIGGHLFGGPAGALLGLLPAFLVIAALATGLRRIGALSELRYIDTCSTLYSSGKTIYPDTPYFVKLCAALESVPESGVFFDRVDPDRGTALRHLAGLGLISRHYDLYLLIGNGHAGANRIYSDPRVSELLEDAALTRLLDARNHEGVLADAGVRKTAGLPGLAEGLEEIDVIGSLQDALGMK